MDIRLIVSLILLIVVTILASYLYIRLEQVNQILEEKDIEISLLEETIKNMNNKLQKMNETLINTLNILQKQNEKYQNLSKEYETINNSYSKLLEEHKLLIEQYKNISKQNTSSSEWEMFKNLSKWFRENSEFYDKALKEQIIAECSYGLTFRIPCAVHLTRKIYGYNNRIDQFNSLKKMMEQGYGDCKSHALALKALLNSLPEKMFLESMKPAPLLDAPYFKYIIYENVSKDGYMTHMLGRLEIYDIVVVCFNYKQSGHCGVALSPINISSYNDIKSGYVLDPLTGEVLGELGKDLTICNSPKCRYEPKKILMVISENWIDYYNDDGWRRLKP